MCAASILLCAPLARAEEPGSASSPAEAVRHYVAGVSHQSASAVCRSFAPRLREALAREEGGAGEIPGAESCVERLASDLSIPGRGHPWAGVRIERERVSVEPGTGLARIDLVMRRRHRLPLAHDTLYALQSAEGWSIVKPGGLLRAVETDGPLPDQPGYYDPPATPATVASTAAIAPPSFSCSAAGTSVEVHGELEDEYKLIPGEAPWLEISRLGAARLADGGSCFSIELAAPPRADSLYTLYASDRRPFEPGDVLEVEVDGRGDPHLLLLGRTVSPGPVSLRPELGLEGSRLLLSIPGLAWPRGEGALRIASASLQPREALLSDPLQAEERAPHEACLEYPSARLFTTEMCGTEPSG